MAIAIYPGSFDPVTNGHLDVIQRASKIMDKLYVGVLSNNAKRPLFSVEERVTMLEKVTAHIPNVEVRAFQGLTIDFAKALQANTIVRGLRAVTDFEYELQLAQTNRILAPDIDTIFMTTNLRYAYLSSSIVKEVGFYSKKIEAFVPEQILQQVFDKISEEKNKGEMSNVQ